MQTKPSYSTVYVAKRLGVSLPTVQRWVDSGRLKAWKTMGGHRRVDAESAEELFRQQAEGQPAADATPLSVVIVDDSADDRDLLTALLESQQADARITMAANGYEGLLLIGQIQPDLVITDLDMPKLDGFELVTRLLAHASIKPPAVIVVTSFTAAQVAQRGELPAQVQLLQKPLDAAQFAAALAAARTP